VRKTLPGLMSRLSGPLMFMTHVLMLANKLGAALTPGVDCRSALCPYKEGAGMLLWAARSEPDQPARADTWK